MSFGRERRHIKNALEINTDIVVSELAMNRATEVKNFTNELNRYYGNRTVHQSVPRHLRRRQASHYPHVLPFRFVKSAILEKKRCESEMKGSKTAAQKMQKKMRRSRRAMRRNFKEYSWGKKQYLMTHIWHAKRCHMREMWGMKIAYERNDKGLRVLLNTAEKKCLCYDESYFCQFCVENNEENRMKMKDIFELNDVILKNEWRMWIANTTKFGPIKIVLNEKRIIIITHPASKQEVICALKGVEFDEKNVFEKVFENNEMKMKEEVVSENNNNLNNNNVIENTNEMKMNEEIKKENQIQFEELERLSIFELIGTKTLEYLLKAFDFVTEFPGYQILQRLSLLPPENTPNNIMIPLKIKIANVNNPRSEFYKEKQNEEQKQHLQKLTTHNEFFKLIDQNVYNQTIEEIIEMSKVSQFKTFKESLQSIQHK